MKTRLKLTYLAMVLGLCLISFMPALAQSKVVFTPQPASVPAGILTFKRSPIGGPAQVAALQAQNAALSAQVAAAAPTIYGSPFTNRYTESSPAGPHLVFAHLQMSAGDYGKGLFYGEYPVNGTTMTFYPGNGPSVASYRQDINEAASKGIDGFACDLGSFDLSGRGSMWMLLLAADQYNIDNAGKINAMGVGKFYIFLQYDFATFPADPASIVSQFQEDATHPSYYTYRGRPWLGTYAGEGANVAPPAHATYAQVKAYYAGILAQIRAGTPSYSPYFSPFFNIRDALGIVPSVGTVPATTQEISGVLSGLTDAFWFYGTGTGPPLGPGSAVQQAETTSALLGASGIKWMGTVTGQYWGAAHGPSSSGDTRFYCEEYGGETLDHQWQSIIHSQVAYWVQLVTWNDFDEASNFSDANLGPTGPWPYLYHSGTLGYYKSKAGLNALNEYYIQWYKTGVQPTLTNDNIFLFYRTQPIGMSAAQDPRGPITQFVTEHGEAVADTFFIATATTKTCTLTVTNGGVVSSYTVPAGLYFTRVPFMLGAVSASLSVNGMTLVNCPGEAIVNAPLVNANYYTAWAHD